MRFELGLVSHDEYDGYDHYEPEPGELAGPYEYLLDELDEPLRELVGGLEHDEDYEADFDEEGHLDGVYTTVRLFVTTEGRDQLLERVEDLAEAAHSARVHQLFLVTPTSSACPAEGHDLVEELGSDIPVRVVPRSARSADQLGRPAVPQLAKVHRESFTQRFPGTSEVSRLTAGG